MFQAARAGGLEVDRGTGKRVGRGESQEGGGRGAEDEGRLLCLLRQPSPQQPGTGARVPLSS